MPGCVGMYTCCLSKARHRPETCVMVSGMTFMQRAKHRAKAKASPQAVRGVIAGVIALVVVTGALLFTQVASGPAPAAISAAPVDLTVPMLDPAQLGQWCVDRQAQGTAGLSQRARNWLTDCIALFGAGLTPSPSNSPSPSPTASPSPSVSPSPTATPSPTASPSPSPTTSPSASPSPSPSTTPPGSCPVAGTNVPGGRDPWGGCWPGPGNTGVPSGTSLSAYTGSCTVTTANTVIDSKMIICSTLTIRATGVIIRRSLLQGTDVTNSGGTGTFTIEDSTVVNGAREQCLCIGDHNFVARRVEVRGGNRSMYCASDCVIEDSWLHGQQLQGAQHGSGLREERNTSATHNVLVCDYPIVNDVTSLGCSADLTGYPDFAPVHGNTIRRNLFLASITSSFCAYGGATNGKPFSGDPLNGTNQKFVENVFQRGGNSKCGFYGPVTDFAAGRSGNVWSGNVWDDGGTVNSG